MKRKSLVGTVLLSMSAWTAHADVAQQQTQQQQQQQQQQTQAQNSGMTLAQILKICQTHEENPQMIPFVSNFECRITKQTWGKIGVQFFPLANRKSIEMKEDIKGGAHQTDWTRVPRPIKNDEGTCDVWENVSYTLATQETFHSCADFANIKSEGEYCAKVLAQDLSACEQEIAAGFQTGGFNGTEVVHCEVTKLNDVKKCLDADILPAAKPTCQQQQQQCQQAQTQCQSVPAQAQAQCQAQAQTQCQAQDADVCAFEPAPLNMVDGVSFEEVVVKKSIGHGKHRSIKVTSAPAEGSILYVLGVRAGDVVSSITRRRTKTAGDFVDLVNAAMNVKRGKYVKITYYSAAKKDWIDAEVKIK